MKTILYKIINKIGYRIERKRSRQELFPELNKYKITENFELLFNAKTFVKSLDKTFDNFTLKTHKAGFLVSFLDYKIYIESVEEFLILNEVFVTKDYNFIINGKAVVIDIGANIGLSSLFFSRLDFVDAIYAFEPVLDTYNQAQYNFELNKSIHKVKQIKNIGLGENNRKETFLFNKNNKGNTGVRGLLSPSYKNVIVEERQVQINEASSEIENIVRQSGTKKIVIKMDCEGAEYEILLSLKKELLDRIDIIILEWHDKGAKVLEDKLIACGFNIFSTTLGPIAGLIMASKN